MKDLRAFGLKLRQLRKAAGLYQDGLADLIISTHAASATGKKDFRLDGNRISKWERAFTDKHGREWKPPRQVLLYLIEIFADQLTIAQAQTWAAQADYQFSVAELEKLFSSGSGNGPLRADIQAKITGLDIPLEQPLVGVSRAQRQLRRMLDQSGPPWLVAIEGIGGIGKTSLAAVLVREIMVAGRFEDFGWLSAKQEEYFPEEGLQSLDKPALDQPTLIARLLEQLDGQRPLPPSPEEKLAILTNLLKDAPYLIVVDNLETAVDYEALLPLLRRLANPTKFLLTSRHNLQAYPDVYCLSLKELGRADSLAFLRQEADLRGIRALAQAPQSALDRIYKVVGGNPLALKLVVGQLGVLPLSQVLENLKEAQGKKVDDLYTHIYWQAWQNLAEAGRQVLLVMPLAQGGPFDQLLTLCELDLDTLNQALEHLVALSLVDVGGDLDDRRYYIHRLTETFLLKEVIKWQSSPS